LQRIGYAIGLGSECLTEMTIRGFVRAAERSGEKSYNQRSELPNYVSIIHKSATGSSILRQG